MPPSLQAKLWLATPWSFATRALRCGGEGGERREGNEGKGVVIGNLTFVFRALRVCRKCYRPAALWWVPA